ncbi:hypothetical protein ABID23_000227 [Bartonella silvatica]|uniref:Uncharacterized protein n=1 Tax=Bartonella silvatica TaxID=357760 RepID=A0ABV2HFH2_9HYPH
MSHMIDFYNSKVERFNTAFTHADRKMRAKVMNDFVNKNSRKIS